ncbi:MFS transporter [Saccharolobus islandicus]|uniref:Major facilitator superfamily MFS_1 n=1 Tax=Saccharolobus islandicus (strain M.16.27) TaxID=427318 RepID=C3N4B2_SACI3|nr:MFS transporter [Sulfolobus islandicus]ACP54837.1 major facilitator superfamily MFS_1 [Sulfolobus islandicus M.16.27]
MTESEKEKVLQEIVARIERLPITKYIWMVFLIASFGYFFDFFEVSMMGAVAPAAAKTFHVSTAAGALLITITLLGMLIGAAIGGYLADKYGRKRMFMITLIGWGSLSLITAASPNYIIMFILRLLTGVFLGIEIPTLDSYLNEILPSKMRGKYFQVVFAIFEWYVPVIFALGLIIIPLSPQAWRYMFIIGGITAIPLWAARIILPESPRWLAVRGKYDEAKAVMTSIEKHIESDIHKKLPSPPILPLQPFTSQLSVKEVFKGRNGKLTAFWLPIYFLSFFGWYFFITALPSILIARGFTIIHSLEYGLASGIGAAALALPPVFTIDTKIGRRGTMIYSIIIMIIAAGIYLAIPTKFILLIAGAIISGMVTIWADVVHQWGPETYTNDIRATATGVNYAAARAGAALAPYVGVVIAQTYGLVGVYITGIIIALVTLTLAFGVPETRRRILEEITARQTI